MTPLCDYPRNPGHGPCMLPASVGSLCDGHADKVNTIRAWLRHKTEEGGSTASADAWAKREGLQVAEIKREARRLEAWLGYWG